MFGRHRLRVLCLSALLMVAVMFASTAAYTGETGALDVPALDDQEIRRVISLVAHRQIKTLHDGDYASQVTLEKAITASAPRGISWQYPWGVALYGMLRAADVLGDRAVETFVLEHNRIAARYYVYLDGLRVEYGDSQQLRDFYARTCLDQLMRLGALDYCGAMGAQMLEGILRHRAEATVEQRKLMAVIADYIANVQTRVPDGTLARSMSSGGTIWIDDLYMSCPFLVRWYEYTGARSFLDDAAGQVLRMADRLQDRDGLFYHGYYERTKKHSPYKWGRGNGWAMVATVEVLSAMPADHRDRDKLLTILRRQIEGLLPHQTPSGMWRQVLDEPALWEETSCTAMFAYSIARAVNRGWIDGSYMTVARRAFAGIRRQVTANGEVNGTCQGTGIGPDLQYYLDRKRPKDDMHGRGP
ncbi:MAG: glycoside hydrolase family 88/105 protein, partial [Bacteroidota bacterium]